MSEGRRREAGRFRQKKRCGGRLCMDTRVRLSKHGRDEREGREKTDQNEPPVGMIAKRCVYVCMETEEGGGKRCTHTQKKRAGRRHTHAPTKLERIKRDS